LVLPQSVVNLQAVSGDGLVQLRWSYQGTQKFTYTLQRKLGSAPVSAYQTLKSAFQLNNYLDTGLLDKTLYDYQVITVDALGLTSTAAVVEALPAASPFVGNPQVSILQNQIQNQPVNQLTWAPANYPLNNFNTTTMYPLGGYYVNRSTDGGGTYQLVATVPSSQGVSQNITYPDQVALVGLWSVVRRTLI
jgi:hypothetical protein